jgi:uncharacterized protein (TIRG00374 family)
MLSKPNWMLIFSILLTLVVVGYVLASLDWETIWAVLENLQWLWVLAAFLAFGVSYLLRSLRFKLLLRAEAIPFRQLFSLSCLYGMFNYLLPARTGELSLPILLNQRHHLNLAAGSAVLLIVRFYDFLAISVLLPFVLLFYWGVLPVWLRLSLIAFCLGVYLIGLVLYAVQRRPAWVARQEASLAAGSALNLPQRIYRFFIRLLVSLRQVQSSTTHWTLLLVTIAIWLFIYTNFYFLVLALGYSITYYEAIVLSIIMIPMTILPVQGLANIGTHEAGWVLALSMFGQSAATALIIAVGSHVLLLFFVLIIGLVGFLIPKASAGPPVPGPQSAPLEESPAGNTHE